ncbi:MAG: phasin family protein [Myxococcales bacterium]
MAMVSETVGNALESARHQMAVLEKSVTKAEKKALHAFEETRSKLEEVPGRVRSAFATSIDKIWRKVAFASRAELNEISHKVDELSKRVDSLLKKRARPA